MTAHLHLAMAEPTKKQLAALKRVDQADERLTRAREDLDAAVRAARNIGCSWQQIADLFGLTRQAAQQRFATVGANRKLAP